MTCRGHDLPGQNGRAGSRNANLPQPRPCFPDRARKSKTERKIAVRFRLAETLKGMALFAQDEDGCEAMSALEIEKVAAEKPEQALENIEKQLKKLGGTEYECSFVRIDLSAALFHSPLYPQRPAPQRAGRAVPPARGKLSPLTGGAVINNVPYPVKELEFQGNVLNHKAAAFYRRHGVTRIEPAAEAHPNNDPGAEMHGRKVMTTRHCIKHQMGWCKRFAGKTEDIPELSEPLTLVDEQGNHYPLRFNCARCEMEIYYRAIEE
jgi:23S rRNA 5-hydroxycytidine C2501 synthase